MFKTILWATDGSPTADRALPFAQALAAGDDRKLVVVHCKELMVAGRASGYPVLADESELEAKILQQVEDLQEAGLAATATIVTAAAAGAAHAIADVARAEAADVIVVGTRGHAPVTGLLVGSVTQRLLHVAPCPVLAVPAGKHSELAERPRQELTAAH